MLYALLSCETQKPKTHVTRKQKSPKEIVLAQNNANEMTSIKIVAATKRPIPSSLSLATLNLDPSMDPCFSSFLNAVHNSFILGLSPAPPPKVKVKVTCRVKVKVKVKFRVRVRVKVRFRLR